MSSATPCSVKGFPASVVGLYVCYVSDVIGMPPVMTVSFALVAGRWTHTEYIQDIPSVCVADVDSVDSLSVVPVCYKVEYVYVRTRIDFVSTKDVIGFFDDDCDVVSVMFGDSEFADNILQSLDRVLVVGVVRFKELSCGLFETGTGGVCSLDCIVCLANQLGASSLYCLVMMSMSV